MCNAKAILRLEDGKIVIVSMPESLKAKYGIKGLEVHPIVATYLVYNGEGKILDQNGNALGLEEVVKRFGGKDFWITFSVYLDLRRRGRKVEPGIESNELILESEKLKIYVFEENALVKADAFVNMVERAMRQNYRVMIAVVDMYGDVTYYEVNKVVFPKLERKMG